MLPLRAPLHSGNWPEEDRAERINVEEPVLTELLHFYKIRQEKVMRQLRRADITGPGAFAGN